MIEIVINGRFLTQPMTGVQRYAYELVRAFDRMLAEGEIDPAVYSLILAVPPDLNTAPDYQFVKLSRVGRLKGNLWEQVSLPLFARKRVLFNPCNIGPVLGGRRQAISIHDASVFAFPNTYTFLFRLKYRLIISVFGRIAPVIFTDSMFSKSELIHYCKMQGEKIKPLSLGHEHILTEPGDSRILEKHNLGKRPYLLSVSSNSPHKNFDGIMDAIQQLLPIDFDVAFTGGSFSKVFKSSNLPFSEHVTSLGYVTDRELRALYENATCFIYPSFYEGFGLPPLEAMACGCPVISSSSASLPEVCGDAVVYCNPADSGDIAQKIAQVMGNPSLQATLREKGYQQIVHFRWGNTAHQMWNELKRVFWKE